MWFGKIEDLKNCKLLFKKDIDKIIDFIKNENLQEKANGKYFLSEENYVNIFSYDTKENDGIFENHEKYIDVHYVICGEEKVAYSKNSKSVVSPYNSKDDYALFTVENQEYYKVNNSYLLVFMAGELHKTGIKEDNTKNIKKAVFKIKTNYSEEI